MPRRVPLPQPADLTDGADEIDLAAVAEIVAATPDPAASLIALLQRVQSHYGYLPEPVVTEIARLTRIPGSQIYGVITFYAQFSTEPSGRHKVCVCKGTACHVRGGRGVLRAVENRLGIEPGATSDDMLFSLDTAACLGACSLAPVMTVDGQYYGKLTPGRVESTLEPSLAERGHDGDH